MVYFLEIMESCFFNHVISLDSVYRIEKGYFKSKYIDCRSLQYKFILRFDTSLGRIEEGQKLSIRCLCIFLLLIFLLSIFLTMLILFSLFIFDIILRSLSQNTKISHLLFIPVYSDRDVLIS